LLSYFVYMRTKRPRWIFIAVYTISYCTLMLAPIFGQQMRKKSRLLIAGLFRIRLFQVRGQTSSWVIPFFCIFTGISVYSFAQIFFYEDGQFFHNVGSYFGLWGILWSVSFIIITRVAVIDKWTFHELMPNPIFEAGVRNFLDRYYNLRPKQYLVDFNETFGSTQPVETLLEFLQKNQNRFPMSSKMRIQKVCENVQGFIGHDADITTATAKDILDYLHGYDFRSRCRFATADQSGWFVHYSSRVEFQSQFRQIIDPIIEPIIQERVTQRLNTMMDIHEG